MSNCCFGHKKDARTKEIDKDLKLFKDEEHQVIKMLLLGTGASGKSTVRKQLVIIHYGGFSVDERQNFKQILHRNVLQCIKMLVNYCKRNNVKLRKQYKTDIEQFSKIDVLSAHLTPEMAQRILLLWETKAIQKAYAKRSEIALPDCCAYLIKHMDRISQFDYVPTNDDVIQARQRTTGIQETKFQLDRFMINLVDMGGQRSERRKWMHCFQDVTALLYCIALNECTYMSLWLAFLVWLLICSFCF